MDDRILQTARELIGKQIQDRRTEKGLSQTALAKLAGVRQADISTIENGARNYTIDTLFKVCAHLEMMFFLETK